MRRFLSREMDIMKKSGVKGPSLFNKGKVSEEVLAVQEKKRLSLLKGLSRSIKEVQVLFANLSADKPGEASISDCRPAQRLCAQFEEILRHGLKLGWFGAEATFWPVVLKVSRKQAIQYIRGLQYAQTDNGRCRAWIRLAVNECSLESYINVICQDTKLLSYYYEAHSFLRSHEMVSALTQLLVGLTELTFKLTVDTASLEFEAAPEVGNTAPLKLKLREEAKSSSKGKKSRKLGTEPEENGLLSDNASVGGVSSVSSGSSDSSPAHTWHIPHNNTPSNHNTPPTESSNMSEQESGKLEDALTEFHKPSLPDNLEEPHVSSKLEEDQTISLDKAEGTVGETSTVLDPILFSGTTDDFMSDTDYNSDLSLIQSGDFTPHRKSFHSQTISVEKSEAGTETTATQEPKFFTEPPQPEETSLEGRAPSSEQVNASSLESFITESPEQNNSRQPKVLSNVAGDLPNERLSAMIETQLEGQPLEQPGDKVSVSVYVSEVPADVTRLSSEELVMEEILPEHRGSAEETGTDITDQLCEEEPTAEIENRDIDSQNETQQTENEVQENTPLQLATVPEAHTTEALIGKEEEKSSPLQQSTESDSNTGTKDTNPFLNTDQTEPVDDGLANIGEQYFETVKRESVTSHDTLVNDDQSSSSSESSLDWGSRSSRDHTPIDHAPSRKSTNPFFDSDEEEAYRQNRLVTDPFEDGDTPTPSRLTQAQNRPISFHIPPPPKQLPSNPFLDDDITPMNEPGNHGNKPHLQQQSSIEESIDTPTIDQYLPSVPNYPKNPSSGFQNQSNETSPSASPLFLLRETSPDSESTVSSQDLSMIMDGTWEQAPNPMALGSPSHLSPTEDYFGAELSQSELVAEISHLKAQLRGGGPGGVVEGEASMDLRRKIVVLQMRLQQIRDDEEEGVADSAHQEVFGHRFMKQPRQTKLSVAPPTCEGCRKQVRGIIRHWYLCKSCGCACHKGCLPKINRRCNQLNRIKEDATYTLTVCPEKGLTQQKFRCGSCTQVFNDPHSGGARLCDYTGLYHCKRCHLNDVAVIPARVVHNWDFTPRKVCCYCADLLTQRSSKALIHVRDVNTHLYTHVTDLSSVEALREDLLIMRTYFIQCRLAREAQLLQQLNQLLHFETSAEYYSLSDLETVQDGTLLSRLQEAHKEYTTHIKEECPLCTGKGYMCEPCGSEEVLFPFDRHTSQCEKCKSVFHRSCHSEMSSCPRCTRIKEKFMVK